MNCSRVLSMTNPALIDELKTLVEPGKVLTDADSLNAYGKDWTKHFAPAPSAIVFPKTIEQVQAIVRWANTHKVALVPSGGRTGLSAAAVAANARSNGVEIAFTDANLLDAPTDDTRFDVIFCRHVLSDLEPARRARVLDGLERRLVDDGCLFLGVDERPEGDSIAFRPVAGRPGLYVKAPAALRRAA